MASLAVRVPEKSIERNNGSELSTWSLWRPSLQQLPYPFCNNNDKHTASQARLHLSGDGNPAKSEINNFSHWAWEKEGSPHSWCRCPLSCCSHREQSLAYKRRIPQADSRLNPHRARRKLKGHSLVFSRLSLCVCVRADVRVSNGSTSVTMDMSGQRLYPSVISKRKPSGMWVATPWQGAVRVIVDVEHWTLWNALWWTSALLKDNHTLAHRQTFFVLLWSGRLIASQWKTGKANEVVGLHSWN